MTKQVYMNPAENRKPAALVSFQSHFQGRCKQDNVIRGNESCATREKSAYLNYDTGIIYLTDKGEVGLGKIFLIQTGTRLRGQIIGRVTYALVITIPEIKENKS